MERPNNLKVGDKFKVIAAESNYEYENGDIVSIVNPEEDYEPYYFICPNGKTDIICWEELEPIQEEPAARLKVGDRVRVKDCPALRKWIRWQEAVGKEATVTHVGGICGNIILNDNQWGIKFTDEMLELIPDLSVTTSAEGKGFMEFQVGDLVKVLHAAKDTHLIGKVLPVTKVTSRNIYLEGANYPWSEDRDLLLVKKVTPMGKKGKGVMRTLTDRLARTLNANLKAFYKLGWIDGDLKVTSEGSNELEEFLFDHFEKELGEVAQAKVKELEAQEKKR